MSLSDDSVRDWRLKELLEAGYPTEIAEQIADRHDVDLHEAIRLVAHECPPRLAAEILL